MLMVQYSYEKKRNNYLNMCEKSLGNILKYVLHSPDWQFNL